MSSIVRILVIDDQFGEANSPRQHAFLRAYAHPSFEFIFESCGSDGDFDARRAIQSLQNHPETDLVLLDIKFGSEKDRLGYRILPLITARFPSVPVLMMSSVDRDIESLGRCLEDGAIGFISKDQKPETFQKAINQALTIANSHVLLGQSPPLRELRRQAARLSPYDQIPVLIVGERGTGKEQVARYIHQNGPRSHGPFIPVNCAAIPESLVEAELFGSEKGAYTGAFSTRIGYLERARDGVLFLDEIGNMNLSTQATLLRVLQDGTFRRVGVSEEELVADIQLICATNVQPDVMIRTGKLREDFYDRVAAVTIFTPPLRECIADLPELANHFLRELRLEGKKRISRAALQIMDSYAWPGNMRELRRVVQEAVVHSEQLTEITSDHLPPSIAKTAWGLLVPEHEMGLDDSVLSDDPAQWPCDRLIAELRMAVAAKRRIQAYKGSQWKAEFMRLMYPDSKAQNAKGFSDLIKRLTHGPWGCSNYKNHESLARLVQELLK